MTSVFNVAVYLYPGADVLDFSGPIELYSTTPPPEKPRRFKTTTFAHQNPVKAAAGAITIVPDATFAEIEQTLEDYDILVVPGAWPEEITSQLEQAQGQQILQLIRRFSALGPRDATKTRIIQSVCSGALILAASGILANRTVTTHHLCYNELKELADKAAGGDSHANVVRKRWVDAGKTEAGVRIVNAGGVSSGLDATLYIIEELLGKDYADWTAEVVEFSRRREEDGWGV